MILIGQYDSSFVRRVGIALTLYDIPFEHRPWSTFGDADKIHPFNPLLRVPILVLDNGLSLVENHLILQHLDTLVGPERALWPSGPEEHVQALRVIGLATGLADKAVSLFYELYFHPEPSAALTDRNRRQIVEAVDLLESERGERSGEHWFGDRLSHADIAVAVCLRHATESHPDLVDLSTRPALKAHCARLEARPEFQTISQPFIPPKR